jgi:hypothetical protein
MKHLKPYKIFESIDEVESIDWNAPWQETWPIVKDIMNRISLKVRKTNYRNSHPSDGGLEWIENKLCLRRDFWEKAAMCWIRSEEFYDEFIDFIVDMNDESNVEVEFKNLSTVDNKWSVRWKIPQKLTDKTSTFDKIESHDVLGTSKLVNMLERAFKACNVKEKDIKWKITSSPSGQGYGEYFIYVEFKVEE